jgi:hypothetical protein
VRLLVAAMLLPVKSVLVKRHASTRRYETTSSMCDMAVLKLCQLVRHYNLCDTVLRALRSLLIDLLQNKLFALYGLIIYKLLKSLSVLQSHLHYM